ncbi:MAG: hypothetical protein EOM22_13850, partial [Gammaproteobacteria bacterium]|nr:hypothetical protein [Gammaproteobacteria bacterium]
MTTVRPAHVLLLVLVLPSSPLIADAQSGPARSDLDQSASVDTSPVDAETSALSESPDQATEQGSDRPKLAFDPAQVGLPGFTDPRASAEDYAEVMSLIEARIAQLEAEGRNRVQEDATERSLDRAEDARIALLGELRTAVQRESVLAARLRELDGALAESQAAAETGETPDLDLGVE